MEEQLQSRALQYVTQTKRAFNSFCSKRRKQLSEIYRTVTSFEESKRADWASSLKVNFASQIENLVTARLSSKNPKFIVSLRQSAEDIVNRYYPIKEPKEDATPEEIMIYEQKEKEQQKFREEVFEWANAVQDYLNFAFSEYGYSTKFRQSAKALVRYGNVYGTVNYKMEKYRKKRKGKIEEVKWREYPDVDIISWSEMYLDPRYIQINDAPAVVRSHERVRLSELYHQEGLMNLDKIKVLDPRQSNTNKQEMYSIRIVDENGEQNKEFKYLTVDKFAGYFKKDINDPKSEGLYEIWTVNDSIVIKFKEIARNPYHSAGCFEDVEQHFSVGYLEPMLSLEREYNFKMNSAIEYINQSLNRSWFWDPNSGVDPKSLSSLGPGSILIAQKGMESAVNGVKELEYNNIHQEYFANNNEIRRDIQTVSHTVDTTAPSQAQGFTNTATAVRARFFESNTVYADTLKHLEEFWTNLAYDILDSIAENADADVIIAKLGKNKFKFAKPEMFEDAPLRYAVQIEMGSSSFDSVENRREEALAKWTIAKDAKLSGVPADLTKSYLDALETFEKVNPEDYLERDMGALVPLAANGQPTTKEITKETKPTVSNPAELTQAVVQGGLTQ